MSKTILLGNNRFITKISYIGTFEVWFIQVKIADRKAEN
jgi:hypothetical protein